jgi:hypothetical protein
MLVTGTRVTICFVCNGYGWSITLYLPTYSVGFVNELPKAQALATVMYQKCNNQTTISFLRLQNAGALRQGIIVPFVATGGNGNTGVQPQSCAYMRLYNASFTASKLIFWRGLYQNAVYMGGRTNPASPWATDAPSIWSQMATDGWCWLGKSPTASLGPQQIASITSDASSHPIITFKAPVFVYPATIPQVKYPLSLAGLQGSDTLNGNWVVKPSSSTVCQFVKQVLYNPWLPGSGSGYSDVEQLIQIGNGATSPTTFGVIERYGERKCGRPLYLSRGRSNRRKAVY